MLVAVLEIGSMLAGYRIEGIVGTGQMATVYLAQSPDLPRHDALKVANSKAMGDEALRARFIREADVGATLTNPHIVTIHRRGEDDGLLWIAMHYVAGGDVETALRDGTITPGRAVEIIADIAEALDYAHSQGVIHRDVKPANFLIADDGRVLLGDFGIAHRGGESDEPGSVAATLAYAAPEVLMCQTIDGRADVYSLGCSLFRLLTGRTPFSITGNISAVIARHLNDPIPRTSDSTSRIPSSMDAVIARALAKDPDDRYPTARGLAAAAAAALRPRSAPVGPTGSVQATETPPASPTTVSPTTVSPTPVHPAPQPPAQPAPPPVESPSPPKSLAPFEIPRPGPESTPPRAHDRARLLRIGGAALAAMTLAVGLVVWRTSSPDEHSDEDANSQATDLSTAATTSPLPQSGADETRLLQALPPGYPADACHAVTPTDGARAKAECSVTPAPDQPPVSVTHLLMSSQAALKGAFDHLLSTYSVVLCPGNIQSPGPWRRNANPGQISGTLACGLDQGHPAVAWTTDSALLLSTVSAPEAGADGSLDPLYAWWTMHS
jgi:serine/threonine-protein kinase